MAVKKLTEAEQAQVNSNINPTTGATTPNGARLTGLPQTGGNATVGADGTYTSSTGTASSAKTPSWKPADTSGNNYAELANMSPIHQAALEAASKSWQEAYARKDNAGMESAHAQAEAIRNLYGYSGGADGSQYIPDKQQFVYSEMPTYTDQYSSRLDAMLNQILNRENFSYDALSDPLYQQYSQQYQREGQRAMKDTLGQVSARTGGMASSYATSAAQQANNYYASQLADKVPELYQLAYQMYLDDIDSQVQEYGLLTDASDRQYDRYQDTMKNWREDRDFAYDRFRDDIDDERYEETWQHQLDREGIEDTRYNDQWQHQLGRESITDDRYVDETSYNKAMDLLESGAMPDDAMLEAAGITKDQASSILAERQLMGNAYNRAMDLLGSGAMPDDDLLERAGISKSQASSILADRQRRQSSSGGSGGGGGGGNPLLDPGTGDTLTEAQIKSMQSFYGVTADGVWGTASKNAADGMNASQAWALYQSYANAKADLGLPAPMQFTSELASDLVRYGLIVRRDGKWSWNGNYNATNYENALTALKNAGTPQIS